MVFVIAFGGGEGVGEGGCKGAVSTPFVDVVSVAAVESTASSVRMDATCSVAVSTVVTGLVGVGSGAADALVSTANSKLPARMDATRSVAGGGAAAADVLVSMGKLLPTGKSKLLEGEIANPNWCDEEEEQLPSSFCWSEVEWIKPPSVLREGDDVTALSPPVFFLFVGVLC